MATLNADKHLVVGALMFPEMDQLDLTGPFEVLSRLPDSEILLAARSREPVRDAAGLVLCPSTTIAALPALDVLVVPGGRGQEELMDDDEVLGLIRKTAATGHVLSICTGALLCGAAGVLRGRRATTHWASAHLLPLFGAVVVTGRFVEDGTIITSAGVTAGIEGALRMAEILRGRDVAERIQLMIEYDPSPACDAGSPAKARPEIVDAALAALAPVLDRRLLTAKKFASGLGVQGAAVGDRSRTRAYAPVTEAVLAELAAICGPENLISGDAKLLARYGHDHVIDARFAHSPDVVVKPATAAEVAGILALATRERIPVTPRGAGSGLSGGAVPVFGGICLSMERMDRILEIDTKNLVAVVEPGVVTNRLDDAAKAAGLFFAGYPMSEEFCFIGGNVAENAGGGRAIKYGVTGRHVTGLEIALPTGELIQLGGKRVKDVTGYDLTSLIVGSEGTLAVVTKVFVRLSPRPAARATMAAFFADVRAAIAVVPAIMTEAKVVPTSIELVDRLCLEIACKSLGEEGIPYRESGAMLLLEVDGPDEGQVKREALAVSEICARFQPIALLHADSEAESERFWRIRKRIPWALRSLGSRQSIEDVVVPIAAIPDLIEALHEIERRFEIQIPCFGHAGDGNLHAHPISNPSWSREEWEVREPLILAALYKVAAGLGGTISGEHGIGNKRKDYLPLVMGRTQIALMRKIKECFDPAYVLNPGKIFD